MNPLVLRSVAAMQDHAARLRAQGLRIGLVPTMGYLHAGHLSLVDIARELTDRVVVSIFVNPTQFGVNEDFTVYPRDFARDEELCRRAGVDVIFHPEASDMYTPDHSVVVDEARLARGLCGASRPGHFRGVATVVAKLFNIVLPHVAVFGAKDAQQARIIQQLVRDLNFPVQVVIGPTLREPGGLAMSSRHARMSSEEKDAARGIYEALQEARRRVEGGRRDADALREFVRARLAAIPGGRVDYVEIVDWDTFEPVREVTERSLIAVAVKVGATRLIDNITPASAAFPGSWPQSLPGTRD